MADESAIQVNFGRAMPLFALDAAVLLPQQVVPLQMFEPRYVQLVERVLDTTGQFAAAVFRGSRWRQEYHARPPLRPAVCVAQIVQHERTEEGRYNLLVQGVCRARILRELPPHDDRLYREAMLEPVGIDPSEESKLYGVRERLTELLEEGPLSQLSHADWMVERIRQEEIPTSVILELVSFVLPTRKEVRYRLLAEADAGERADLIEHELVGLRHVLKVAMAQRPERWPKGLSWN
jgi:Lon protease-like protein